MEFFISKFQFYFMSRTIAHEAQPDHTKFYVKRKIIQKVNENPKNIFHYNKMNQTTDTFNKSRALSLHQICGDKQFKIKFIRQASQKMNQTARQSINKSNYKQQNPQQSKLNQTSRPFLHKTIYLPQSHHNKFLQKLSKDQQNSLKRQKKSLQKFNQTQLEWQKIDKHLKSIQPKSQTVTFNSINKMYIHQNEKKIDIINDMIPQYWKNSLRSNHKHLYTYLKGNHFKNQHAQEMLQTLKGQQKLENSIPKLDHHTLNSNHHKLNNNQEVNSYQYIKLVSKKLQKQQGYQTMKQFHENFSQTITHNFREKNIQQNNKKINNKTTNFFIDEQDIIQKLSNMSSNARKTFKFSKTLQKLQKIDNEVYQKAFNLKGKWLNQGLRLIG